MWNICVDYDNLDKWLKQKERMVSVIGAVSVDPKVIDSQVLQIEVCQVYYLLLLFYFYRSYL